MVSTNIQIWGYAFGITNEEDLIVDILQCYERYMERTGFLLFHNSCLMSKQNWLNNKTKVWLKIL